MEKTEREAEQYVENRLLLARLGYSQPVEARPGNERVVVELDGCHIRTGKKVMIASTEVTKKRRLVRSQRPPDWREDASFLRRGTRLRASRMLRKRETGS